MTPPARPRPTDAVSALAVMVKNLVRPWGLARLGLPTLLTGSGMAFPWELIASSRLGTPHIVEDMQLAIDLAVAGHPAAFCGEARITAPLPAAPSAAQSQRRRWEHGHLATILRGAPRLVAAAVRRGKPALAAMALDLCVPPLSLLTALWIVTSAAAAVFAAFTAAWLPLAILGSAGFFLASAVLVAWASFGRRELPGASLLAAPWYMLMKLPLYAAFLVKRQRTWVRTQRDASSS